MAPYFSDIYHFVKHDITHFSSCLFFPPLHSSISDPKLLLIVCMDTKDMKPVTVWLNSKTINTARVKITLATAAAEPTSYKCCESVVVCRNSSFQTPTAGTRSATHTHGSNKPPQPDYRWMDKCLSLFPVVDLIMEAANGSKIPPKHVVMARVCSFNLMDIVCVE